MANLGFTFNTAEVEDTSFDAFDGGTFTAIITESEMCATKDGTGEYLKVKVELQENGRTLFHNFNLKNKSDIAMKIGASELKKLCEACGKPSISNSEEVHNIRFKAEVVKEMGKPYMKDGVQQPAREQNRIKKFMPYSSTTEQQPTNAVASGDTTPPWKK